MSDKHPLNFYNIVAHDPFDARHHGAVSMPVYQNSLFAFDDYADFERSVAKEQFVPVYSRGANPTVAFLESKLAALERGERARCFASGMAAISATLHALLRTGDHVICVDQAYGPTRQFLNEMSNRYGVEVSFVGGRSADEFAAALRPNTRLIYLESPTSIRFQLQDLRAVTELARRAGALTVADNSWASPYFQQPLAMGVDLVIHSLSKYVSGHSDCIGGAVIGRAELIGEIFEKGYMLLGGIMTPQTAALMTRGLRTLPLRMERHHRSGLAVAEYLDRHPRVVRVNHPGLASHPQHELAKRQLSGYGSLFSFETEADADTMKKWAGALNYFRIGVSWGGFESLVTVHALDGNGDGGSRSLIRLFVGMEDPDTLIEDMERAWKIVQG
jgi:Cystathionine beta-lyases/cystathionine gamma-synthases